MGQFQFAEGPIKGLYIIEPKLFKDARGYFLESYNLQEFKAAGICKEFVQDNQSKSRKGVIRGLHFQIKHPQGKLVRVLKGEVFDVAVDLRGGSPTYGQWYGKILSEENGLQMYVPEGFAHGFLVLSEEAEFIYKCTDFYYPQYEGSIAWNDPDIGIKWPLAGIEEVLLSEKDKKAPSFRQCKVTY